MTVEELIRKLRDVVLACPEAAQFPVTSYRSVRDLNPERNITVTINLQKLTVEVD